MLRRLGVWGVLWLLSGAVCLAAGKFPEVIDPAEAQKDPDFGIQGEYLGRGTLPGIADGGVGAQVVAQGHGEFNVVVYQGGLPGQGWKRGDKRFNLSGKLDAAGVTLKGVKGDDKLAGQIAHRRQLTLASADGQARAALEQTQRQSPTMGAAPPSGAMVLFGSGVNQFPGSKVMPDGNLMSEATSVPLPANYKLHVEFRLSWMPTARGQARSNSGVYLHNCYEVQVLDSFGLEGLDNECGGFYHVKAPEVNMCLPPLAWQTYDVDLVAPKYEGDKKVADARISVLHNGVPIHENADVPHDTPGRQKEGPPPRPLYLQGHGNHVEFRNVWIVPKP